MARSLRALAAGTAAVAVAGALAVGAVGGGLPAGAATTQTSFMTDCVGVAGGIEQGQQNQMNFTVDAPAEVEVGQSSTIRITPGQSAFPDSSPSPIGEVPVHRLRNIKFMYDLPTGADVAGVAVVAGSGQGLSGTPTVEVDDSYTPARIVLAVPEVPKNPTPPTNETFFRLPAVDIDVTATGAVGDEIRTRVAGRNRATSGYTFQADSVMTADVSCWPEGEVNAPVMSVTEIVDEPVDPGFSDVPPSHPFFDEITWMAETGLSTGYQDGTYRPADTLTRQAMSAFLYRVDGSPQGEDPGCEAAPFSDVPVSNPFCGEIAWMAAEGISTGYEGGTYRPADGLTRQAMSGFLYRLAGSPEGQDPACEEPPFDDVPVSNPFCGEIAWMAAAGISTGFGDGTFGPDGPLTRGAMSAFLFRYDAHTAG